MDIILLKKNIFTGREVNLISVMRVEKHLIKKDNEYYSMLEGFCHLSKNLYNFANYHARQSYIDTGRIPNYNELEKLSRHQPSTNNDYKSMPIAQAAQQTLRLLEKNWVSYNESHKDYKENPDKYTGRPRLPGYLPKDGGYILTMTNQNCKMRDNIIYFPKTFEGLTAKITGALQQIRILPKNRHVILEVVYKAETPEELPDNGRYMGIDIGLDNLAAVGSNTGMEPVIINGKGLKSMNKYYNKQKSYYQEIAKSRNDLEYSNRMNELTIKRNWRVEDKMHKASRYIVNLAMENEINTIVIGNNKDWKRESPLSKNVNQTFVGLPHQRMIEMIRYKGENVGIQVKVTEESYTSGTSFPDNEMPIKENYKKSRRVYRGLFKSNEGQKINADINASLQIIKKVFPNAFSNGIEGVGLSPVVVNVS